MKVLSIGNSFSQDTHKWLHKLAVMNGVYMECVNLYIGGCSLERHWSGYVANDEYYSLEINGNKGERKVTLREALDLDQWDVITVQQASPLSGKPQSYFPFLQNLVNAVREKQPNAKIYFLQTWSYERDATLSAFDRYDRNQHEMFRRLTDASEMASKVINAPLIKSGTVIQALRDNVEDFDRDRGGIPLTRDGFHLSLDYGRFASAATTFCTLTERRINVEHFEDFDTDRVKKIVETVENVVFG